MIDKSEIQSDDIKAKFLTEFEIHSSLNHDHIIKVLHSFFSSLRFFLFDIFIFLFDYYFLISLVSYVR